MKSGRNNKFFIRCLYVKERAKVAAKKKKFKKDVGTLNVHTYICNVKSIGEEIQQSEFSDVYQKLGINILFTAAWFGELNRIALKDYDISLPQYNVLRILRGQKGQAITVAGLCERMIDKSSNASRIVDKLETRKLVSRRVCDKDRRQVDVVITERGTALLEELDEKVPTFKTIMSKQLSNKDAEALNFALDQIRNQK
jgi:DNA-binding MarR family transcriptional regulator